MKGKRVLLISAFFVTLGIMITARSGGPAAVLNEGYTGAPGDAGTCTSCHSGGAFGTVTPQIQIFQVGTTTPVASYVPGTQYDMRVTVNASAGTPARYGFQFTTLRVTGNTPLAGYSNLASGIHQTAVSGGAQNGRTYVEHSSPSVSNQFNFRWTAPAAGTGNVRFYASGNAVNNNGGSNGDTPGNAFLQLGEQLPVSVTGTPTQVTCNGLNNGAINITATGGQTPYTYLWNDGNTNEDRTGLAPGSYSVTVTDGASATATASFTITQPPVLGITATIGTILCNGGTAAVTIAGAGGTPPYTGNGTFNLPAGTHTRTVTDSKGCTKDTTFTLTQPTAISVSASAAGPIPCSGTTTVTVTASGGTGTLTGAGTFNESTAGQHTYTVTDANNCTASTTILLTSASGITANLNVNSPGCADTCGGELTSVVQTASLPYVETLTKQPGGQVIAAGDFDALCPGTYTYTVQDNAGCTFTSSVTVVTPQPPVVTLNGITQANGGNNGAININVTGGATPYGFLWSNSATTEDLSNVGEGTYQVIVTGSNDCADTLGNLQVFDVLGVEEQEAANFSAFPNPFNGSFQLNNAAYKVTAIRDISGRQVAFIQTGQNVRLKDHVAGVYFVDVRADKKILSFKIVAE